MTEREREARRLRTLVARLRQDRTVLAELDERLGSALERARAKADPDLVAAVALYTDNLYTAVEDTLRAIGSDVDGAVPSGPDWHRELLRQLTIEIETVRPPVLDESLREDLDTIRRFRHRVRHAYFQPHRLERMAEVLGARDRVMRRLPDALRAFETFLGETIRALEKPGE